MKALKWDKQYNEIVFDILGTICLTYMILFFIDMANELYQAPKNVEASKALFMFAAFMFITQRVRLLNWQSLLASVLYWPVGYMYRNRFIEAPTVFERDKTVAWICWILILIIVDMFVYKKVNPLQKFHKPSLCIFALMAFFMNFYRNERTSPIIFLILFIFYLIPIDKERWKHIIYQICGAWVLSTGNIIIRSIRENPELSTAKGLGRWYGCFVNIGDFGLFMAAATTVVLFLLFSAKYTYGRKSIPYIAAWICLLPVVWTVCRVSTLTMLVGIACVFLMGFVVMAKSGTLKSVIFRGGILLISFPVMLLGALLALKALANTDLDYWTQVLQEGNTFIKPIADLIYRAHYMFDKSRTFANCGIFEEGSLINYLDLLTTGRLSLTKAFSAYFNFTGNISFGIDVGTYFAYNTHNAYSQFIFEYGYVGGGLFCVWFASTVILGIKRYVREHKPELLFVCLWLAMTAGVMLGEIINMYSPVIVMTLIINYSLIINVDENAVCMRQKSD